MSNKIQLFVPRKDHVKVEILSYVNDAHKISHQYDIPSTSKKIYLSGFKNIS